MSPAAPTQTDAEQPIPGIDQERYEALHEILGAAIAFGLDPDDDQHDRNCGLPSPTSEGGGCDCGFDGGCQRLHDQLDAALIAASTPSHRWAHESGPTACERCGHQSGPDGVSAADEAAPCRAEQTPDAAELQRALQVAQIRLRAADALAAAVDRGVRSGYISSRSEIADARLDYGEPGA
jgi:hypothetical protein